LGLPLPRLADLRDPLLERDYVRICSRPASFRNRTIAVVVASVVLLMVWAGQRRGAAPDRIGRDLHVAFTWTAGVYVGLMALFEAAVAVPTERATGTLTVLLTVPRTPRRLAAGFLLSRSLAAFTALLGLAPLAGTSLLLGGVSLRDGLMAIGAVASAGIHGAAVGFLTGHAAADHRRGLGRAMAVVLLWNLLLPLLLGFAAAVLASTRDAAPTLRFPPAALPDALLQGALGLFFLGPGGALVAATNRWVSGNPVLGGEALVAISLGVSLLLAAASVLVAGRRLRLETEMQVVASGRRGLLAGLFRRRGTPGAAAAAAPARPTGIGDRPLWWKEMRPPRAAWARWSIRVAVIGYALFLGWLWFDPDVRREVRFDGDEVILYDILVSLPLWLLALGVLAASGPFVAEERERSALDLLRATPLGPWDYILARPLGILRRLAPALVVTGAFALLGVFMGIVHAAAVAAWIVGAALVIPALALLSFARGMAAPTVRSAQRRMGTLVGTFLLLWPLGVALLGFVAGDDWVQNLFAPNPLVALAGPFVTVTVFRFDRTPDGEAVFFLLLSWIAALAWALYAWISVRSLPHALREALHAGEEG
jgi:hypothetical protein